MQQQKTYVSRKLRFNLMKIHRLQVLNTISLQSTQMCNLELYEYIPTSITMLDYVYQKGHYDSVSIFSMSEFCKVYFIKNQYIYLLELD